jgi:ATP phosphoribosyltransferase
MNNSKKKIRVAIPKGALFDHSKDLLSKAGIEFNLVDRKLIFESLNSQAEILLVKPVDVPVYVENGAADLGIVGSDVLAEAESKVLTLMSLGYGHCDLAVAAPKEGPIKTISQIQDYSRVATKFPKMARQFFRQQGIAVELIGLNGSIEIAPLTGLADVIVDLVATGATLRENGLVVLDTISKHSARLIANRVSWQINHAWMISLLESISGAKQSLREL